MYTGIYPIVFTVKILSITLIGTWDTTVKYTIIKAVDTSVTCTTATFWGIFLIEIWLFSYIVVLLILVIHLIFIFYNIHYYFLIFIYDYI